MNLHFAHDIGIDKAAHKESHERCCRNAGRQTKYGMEARFVVPIGCARNPVAQSSHCDEEKVHGKAAPYQQAGLAKTPYFANTVVDNVRHGENNQPTRQADGAYSYLLGLQQVCQNEANTKQYAEKHKQHTDVLFTLNHSLVLL